MRISDWSSDVCSSDLFGELGEWHEDRRTRADDHGSRALACRQPRLFALAVVHRRMKTQHVAAEPRAQALRELRRQADFRHQHQCLPAAIEHGAQAAQIQFGLAAAGHAFEQADAKAEWSGVELVERSEAHTSEL